MAVQSQKMARGLQFWIKEVEGLYYLCSKTKALHGGGSGLRLNDGFDVKLEIVG